MQAEFFTTRPVTIDIPIFQPLYALAALGVVIFVVAWLLTHRHNWRQWLSKLPRLHERAGVNVVYYAALILAVPWLLLIVLTFNGLFELWYSKPNPLGEGFTENTLRLHFLALAGLTTILAGLVGAPLALLRVHTVERQTTAQEEGLITDRINKAVEGLGAEKTRKKSATNSAGESRSLEETLPNLEVRIGAIFALERIAQDSLRDHIQIMEILCAYIRQNAPASEAPELPKPPAWFEVKDPLPDDTWKAQFYAWKREHREALQNVKPRGDIQTALTVIGRRSDRQIAKEWGDEESYKAFQKGPPNFPDFEADELGAPTQSWRDAVDGWQKAFEEWKRLKPAYRLDLRETNLRKADMSGVSQKADFSHGRFDRADLQGVDFWRASAQVADFEDANAQGANFGHANAQGADFGHANAQGAYFRGASAQGADFWGATFDEGTDFSATKFLLVALKSDISMLKLTQEQVNAAFGDGFTARHLPEGLTKPDHWPDWDMEVFEFDDEWHKWQREGTAYTPPPKPAE